MPACMAAVLLGCARRDELGADAQADPPGQEVRESTQGGGGQGHPGVGTDARGYTARVDAAGEHGLGFSHTGGGESRTAEAHAAVAIGHRPGITVQAVPSVTRAVAIGTPPLVGRSEPRGRLARMAEEATVTLLRDQAAAAHDSADRGAPRPRPARMPWVHERPQCLGAACRVPTTHLHDGLDAVLRRLLRAAAWGARTSLQPWGTGGEIALKPLGARLTTDAVPRAQRRDRPRSSQVVRHAWEVLVHGSCVSPGHGAPPWVPTMIINVCPMSLDSTVTHVSGLYPNGV